jgi:hypothetical protein
MGAVDFYARAKGRTAKEAFLNAQDEARYEYGHGGYTGTIAEKRGFRMISVPADKEPRKYARELMDDDNHFVQDKFGDAGCVQLAPGDYLFFGFASS